MADDYDMPEVVHQSSSLLALQIVLLQLLLALLSATFTYSLFYVIPPATNAALLATLIILANIVLHAIDAGILVYLILRWKNTAYSVSPQRVVIHKGGPKVQEKIFDTSKLGEIEVDQSPLGKVMDYGTITFTAPGADAPVQLPNVPHPWHYAKVISQGAQAPE